MTVAGGPGTYFDMQEGGISSSPPVVLKIDGQNPQAPVAIPLVKISSQLHAFQTIQTTDAYI